MQTFTIKVDFRILSIILGLIILVMLILWQPWLSLGQSSRTISVTGQGTLLIEPDQFIFTPTYQASADNLNQAQQQATEQGNAVVAKLKEMGIADQDIKTSVANNQGYAHSIEPVAPDVKPTESNYIATYSLTITLRDKDQAQQVLDYLATTSPLYALTPQSTLTTESRQKYELEARKKALAHAKQQAETSAAELDASVGKALQVSDLQQTGGFFPLLERDAATTPASDSGSSAPTLQTGQQEVTFSLSVEYELK